MSKSLPRLLITIQAHKVCGFGEALQELADDFNRYQKDPTKGRKFEPGWQGSMALGDHYDSAAFISSDALESIQDMLSWLEVTPEQLRSIAANIECDLGN